MPGVTVAAATGPSDEAVFVLYTGGTIGMGPDARGALVPLDLRELGSAPATAAVVARIREHVPGPGTDRFLAPEIESVVGLVAAGSLVEAAASVTGPLPPRDAPRA